ncbi:hypothetical protein ROZALSC1DRAFT_26333, partial [Rozella allomycis CSF55]
KIKQDINLSEDDIASLQSVCTQIDIELNVPSVVNLNTKSTYQITFNDSTTIVFVIILIIKKQILNSILNRTNDFNGVNITKTSGTLTDDPDQVLLNVSHHFESLFAPKNYDENTSSITTYWDDNFPPLEHINPNIYST